ncbi:MAG: thioredoxin [Bacteroidota bacterium]
MRTVLGVLFSALLVPTAFAQAPDSTRSEAEQFVANLIETDGIHVVHFWAPWCGNSRHELENGFGRVIDDNEDVSFTFVTVRNNGNNGEATLRNYGIDERVPRLAHPGSFSDDGRPVFLGHTVYWTPTTWIYHRNGRMAFAMNYGEVTPEFLQSLIDATRSEWPHD